MKTILFDFFGVLSTPPYSPFIRKYIAEAEQQAWLDKLNVLDLGELPEPDFVTQLSKRTGLAESAIWAEIDSTPQPNEPLYNFIEHELKNHCTVGLLTNVPSSLIRRLAGERLKLFDIVIISSEVKLIKPDPRIFELAVERTDCPAHEIVFIDDRIQNVEAAQNVGLQGMIYTDLESLKQSLKK